MPRAEPALRPSPPRPWAPVPLPAVALALLLGAGIAALVVAEPWWRPRWLGGLFGLGLGNGALAAAALLLPALAWAASRRVATQPAPRLLLAALVVALHTMALRAGPLNLLNLTIVLLGLWWLADLQRSAFEPRRTSAQQHLLVLFGVLAIASAWRDPELARGLVMLLPKLAMAVMLLRLLRHPAELDLALQLLVGGALLAAALGLAQSATYSLFGIELHRMEDEAPRFITVLGMNLLRASGLQPNPQAYCHALTISLVLLGSNLLAERHAPWHRQALRGAGMLLLALAVAASFARGPWLAALGAVLLLPVAVWPRRTPHWLALLGLTALVGLHTGVLNSVLDAYRDFTSTNTDVRLELLRAGADVVAVQPLHGVGLGNFGAYSPSVERYPVHNAPMQVATELGLPALAVFVAMATLPLVQVLRRQRQADPATARRLRTLALAHATLLVNIQGDPMAYSELLLFHSVLLVAAARLLAPAVQEATR